MFCLICLKFLLIVEASSYAHNLHYSISEELQVGSIVGELKKDFLLESKRIKNHLVDSSLLRFSFSPRSKNHNSFFNLDGSSGVMSNNQILDREFLCRPNGAVPSCSFTIDVKVTPKENFAILKVTVELMDVNDNPPKFPEREMRFEISEQTKLGHSFSLPSAQDRDGDAFGISGYFIDDDESDRMFVDTFKLISQKMLDGSFDLRLEVKNKIRAKETALKVLTGKVVAMDKGIPPHTDFLSVVVSLVETSEHEPHFVNSVYRFSVFENAVAGALVGEVKATLSNDTTLQYYIPDQPSRFRKFPFKINPKTGNIHINGSVDYESDKMFKFNVTAFSFLRPSASSAVPVEITVIDVNDCTPDITINTLTKNSKAQIKENSPEGTFVSHISVVDRDSELNAKSFCYAQSSYFALEAINGSSNGQEFKLVSAAVFDREDVSRYDVQIVCEEIGSPNLSSKVMLEVDVLDENDNAPFFGQGSYSVDLHENTPPGSSILVRLRASDVDEGQNSALTYHLFPADSNLSDSSSPLFVDELDGGVYSRRTFDYEEDTQRFLFIVMAVDSGETKQTGTTTLTLNIVDVNDNPPRFAENMYEFYVSMSELFEGNTIGSVKAVDVDKSSTNSRITYAIHGSPHGNSIDVDPLTGELSWSKILSNQSLYNFYVSASNGFTNEVLNTSVPVVVRIVGLPKIIVSSPPSKSEFNVFTGSVHKGVPIFQVKVESSHLKKPRFELLAGNDEGEFDVDTASGAIVATREIELGLSFFNFTIQISDEDSNFEQTVLYLPIFVNNTNHHQFMFGSWTDNPSVLALVVGFSVALLALLVLLAIVLALRHKCRKTSSTVSTNKDVHVGHNVKVTPNLYESDPKIHVKAELDRRKEVKFSLVNLEEEEEKGGSSYYNHVDSLYKNRSDAPYDPWMTCSKKPRDPTHEEETSLTDSGKGTSDEGDITASHVSKIKDSKLSDAVGLDNFNQSIISREKRLSNQHSRLNSTCLAKTDNLLPLAPLELSFHCTAPSFRSFNGEDCELCLMDQRRMNKTVDRIDSSVTSITTTV